MTDEKTLKMIEELLDITEKLTDELENIEEIADRLREPDATTEASLHDIKKEHFLKELGFIRDEGFNKTHRHISSNNTFNFKGLLSDVVENILFEGHRIGYAASQVDVYNKLGMKEK